MGIRIVAEVDRRWRLKWRRREAILAPVRKWALAHGRLDLHTERESGEESP
jgi:hypothetical protein